MDDVGGNHLGFESVTLVGKEIALIVPPAVFRESKHRIGNDMRAIQPA
jgi:hypothetical protein